MRLIDADELKKVGLFNGKWDRENGNEHFMYGVECVIDFINNLPTIEAEPVKHGKWEEMRNAYGELEGWIHAECGREVKCMENFCPNCGARMDGDKF